MLHRITAGQQNEVLKSFYPTASLQELSLKTEKKVQTISIYVWWGKYGYGRKFNNILYEFLENARTSQSCAIRLNRRLMVILKLRSIV